MTVHTSTKAEIMRFALAKRAAGEYYDLRAPHLEDTFRGSIDRFCDIALAFRQSRRVLDVGSGNGLLPALLKMLGHDVYAVDLSDRRADDLYARHGIPPSPSATWRRIRCPTSRTRSTR